MRNDTAGPIRRQDYTPPPYLVDQVELVFDLDPDATRVCVVQRLRRNPAGSGPLRLDGDGLSLLELRIDDQPVDPARYLLDEAGLTLPDPPERFVLTITNELSPASNSALMGLYVSQDNFFTQCEAQGFRRITFYQDRPDVMAPFKVTLRADRQRCPVLLSNGNLVGSGTLAAGDGGADRHWATWVDPFPKPSYLFAIVAGRLAVRERTLTTASGREVLLQVWVEPGNEDKTSHAMDSLVHAVRWDEQRYGLELDLDRFMIVAVGDFNMGAMENKGLNIFNTKYVFAHPRIATDVDFANVESVVGHEYFHNWTGNRVTCRDWFQLTLKEGLTVFRDQEFSADLLGQAAGGDAAAAASGRAVKRIEDVRVLRSAQFPEDAGPMAHPIRPDEYLEINNFYTVTVYEKGAEVIRMLQTLVGRDGFRRGMDLYFERHDGQAVTCEDFVAAIADANGRDLAQFRRWYSQAGTPRLKIDGSHDAAKRTFTLRVRQLGLPTPGQPTKLPLHVPLAVGLVGEDGRDLPLRLGEGRGSPGDPDVMPASTMVLEVTEPDQRFVFTDVDRRPTVSLLRNFSAPVIVDHDYSDAELAFLAAHDADPFNRWEASQRLTVACVLATLDGAPAGQRARTLVEAFERALADPALGPAFKEQFFVLPSEGFIAEQLTVVDPGRVRQARDAVRDVLAHALAPSWRATFEDNRVHEAYAPEPGQAARRALANVALQYWVATGDGAACEAAERQFAQSDNMTDRQAALGALLNSPAPQRHVVLAAFASEFAGEPLVMDKWFSLQATMHRQPGDPPVLERVRTLIDHPAFSLKNPNKVRALIGAFCNGNLAEFHTVDGAGYEFWAEQVLRLDAINPQVAARIARALDRWRKFERRRQDAMHAALQRVAAHRGLSNDVSEIVGKALSA